eukprot:1384762-Amorphochlora_amoeboformis.AAC.1
MRVNGCESPLSSSQVVAAVAVFGNAALYYGFVYNFAPRSFEGLLGYVYLATCILSWLTQYVGMRKYRSIRPSRRGKWLNTCIGAANYRQFFLMLICIVGMQIVHFILGIYLFTLPEVEDIAERKFGAYIAYAAVMGVSLISPLIVSGAVGSLLAFHIYIKCIGTTT